MVDAGERRPDQAKPPAKGNGVKTGRKEKGFQLDAEGRELRAHGKERDHREGFPTKSNRRKPGAKPATVSEQRLIALGGRKDVVLLGESRRQARIVFGGEGETRLIFTPEWAAWKVAVEGEQTLEELKRELRRAGRGLWDNDKNKPKPKPGGCS
jgi:hypothetical protein